MATSAAFEQFGLKTIVAHVGMLTRKAELAGGLDWLQMFSDPHLPERRLWFIEDGLG